MKSSACNRMENIQLNKTENITEKLLTEKLIIVKSPPQAENEC